AARNGLKLVPFKIRHLGTDRCLTLLKGLRAELEGKVEMRFDTEVVAILPEGDTIRLRTEAGEEFTGRFVIMAPGRGGAPWLRDMAGRLGLSTVNNPVDIGVRVEVPASILRPITDVVHEAKFIFSSKRFDDQVRTFCMNPYGEVVKEVHKDFVTVNGHSYSTKKTENTNFAILVSTSFTEPFHEPIAYGQYIAKLANLLGEGIIVQRLGDLLQGRRSTPERIKKGAVGPTLKDATPGDLSFAIPYRYISDILEMLEALDKVAPGVYSTPTLLYGVEVKFYSMRLKLSNNLETEVKNLFAVGDGAGITRGLVQASASGVMAAREVLKRVWG
ncbi:MAG: FAD-dependent oxidoreductase, partial [Deltaproteobacteria bacterium]|nr:FAD-dependent oxidoreductase [Deltaproteobacteria bacterium]